jgi:hypothetical protein
MNFYYYCFLRYAGSIASDDIFTVSDELGRMWKEAILAHFR